MRRRVTAMASAAGHAPRGVGVGAGAVVPGVVGAGVGTVVGTGVVGGVGGVVAGVVWTGVARVAEVAGMVTTVMTGGGVVGDAADAPMVKL
jgi:hypothetical protein